MLNAYHFLRSWVPGVTPAGGTLIAVLLVVHIAQEWFRNILLMNFALWPIGEFYVAQGVGGREVLDFQIWQLFTHSLLHSGTLHLFINIFGLWMFGSRLEEDWGGRRFLLFYTICVLSGAVTHILVTQIEFGITGALPSPVIGASGGIFGILLAFGILYPNERIMLLIPPIPLKAKYVVILFGIFELFAGITGTLPSIAHFAHLGGMIGGYIGIKFWIRSPR